MKYIYTLLFVLLFLPYFSQDPTPPGSLQGQALKDWLKANWYDPFHSSVGYTSARQQMYSFIDDEAGLVYCVYTGFNQASSFTTFLDPINTEHSVPQSFYNSAEPMRSDIHHLYPTHENVNTARSNLPFDDSPDATTDNWYIGTATGINIVQSIPSTNIDEYSELESGDFFEPREDHKGDVARSLFYFYTMYPTQAGDISLIADINVLYQWHLQDPVDSKEITRNQRIQQTQGNYNPYVNLPGLVATAWGFSTGTDACGCPVSSSINTINQNPNLNLPKTLGNQLNLPNDKGIEEIEIFDQLGNLVLTSNETDIDIKNLPDALYTIKVHSDSNIYIYHIQKL